MNIGITLLFKKTNSDKIQGILKSSVIMSEKQDVLNEASKLGNKISGYYNYDFLGINDIFNVSGKVKQGEILGRTSFYEYNTYDSAKGLTKTSSFLFDKKTELSFFNVSFIYFCKNIHNEKFTISVLSIIKSLPTNVHDEALKLGTSDKIINKIIINSIDEITDLKFVGIEEMYNIDLKFDVFQTLYSDFEDLNHLKDEVLKKDEFEEYVEDIFDNDLN